MWSLRRPSDAEVQAFLARWADAPFSYPDVGLTRALPAADGSGAPAGFDLDHNRAHLGDGEAAFEAAKRAIARWVMFPRGWTRIVPYGAADSGTGAAPVAEGTTVAMVANALGLWWRSSCRIVYVLDEAEGPGDARYGFAYGTLPGHVEYGEERFSVEMHADGSVWYDLLAFSRPHYWAARLAKPLARRLQRRFVRDSLAAMRAAMADAEDWPDGG